MSDVKSVVQRQFGQVAAAYSTSAVHAKGVDLAEMVNSAQLAGHERILDAGCGAGHTALKFAPHVTSVVAIDLTERMLAQGRQLAVEQKLNTIDFRLADVERLPFDHEEFDVVVSRYSAHHWPHPQLALREFKRVLRPGGRFILSDIVSYDDFSLDTFLQTIELLRDPSHVRDHSARQWLAMFSDAGFAGELVYTWDVWLDFADWVAHMATPLVHIAALRALLDNAPAEVRSMLRIEADHSFTLQGGLLRGRKMGDA